MTSKITAMSQEKEDWQEIVININDEKKHYCITIKQNVPTISKFKVLETVEIILP
jgi:hypothetical protein